MKADTSLTISSSPKRPSRSTADKTAKSHASTPLSDKGPWFRMDGVWYTKNEAGEIVPMKA